MDDAAELVERLRSNEIESFRSEVAAGRSDHILKTLDERGSAQELVRQQYTGRYPFELLQNANDAAADTVRGAGKVCFVLTTNALIVADQGVGFGAKQIEAICRLGRSSKDPRKSIGYKGLGFKSVGEICETPQIVSGRARFGFNERAVRDELAAILLREIPAAQRLPVYAFPFSVRESDLESDLALVVDLLAKGYQTVMRLPLKAGVDRAQVDAHLGETLSPRLLLFLHATDELELRGASRSFSATVVRVERGDHLEVLLDTGSSSEHWLVYQRTIGVIDRSLVASLGDAWQEVDRVRVAAAIPLGGDGRPASSVRHPLHVYFPTQEVTGFRFILQGDFALELDRRRVAQSPEALPYNTWLLDELANLVGDWIAPDLCKQFPNDSSVISILAPAKQAAEFGQAVRKSCVNALRGSEFIPVVDGTLRCANAAVLLPGSVPDAGVAHRFLDLREHGSLVLASVEDDESARRFLVEELGAKEASLRLIVERLTPPPPDLVVAYYEFLVGWAANTRDLRKLLTDVRCVRKRDGTWAAPSEGLFFPRQRGGIEFPSGLDVPIADLPDVEGLRELLNSAGVRSFEWRQLLPEFVLKILGNERESEARRSAALEALRQYYKTDRTGDLRLLAQIATVLLPARDALSRQTALRPAGEIYFSSGWLNHDRLEQIYGGFEQAEFLAASPPSDETQRVAERDFLAWVGVSSVPRINARLSNEDDRFLLSTVLWRHPHRRVGTAWDEWLRSPEVAASRRCSQGHPESQRLNSSYALDRFDELVGMQDAKQLAALWHELAAHWGRVYEPAFAAEIYCQHSQHSGERSRRIPSVFAHCLRTRAWIPALRKKEPGLAVPEKAWRITRETPRRVAERVAVLWPDLDTPAAGGLIASLGIVDAARLKAEDLSALLSELAVDYESCALDSELASDIRDAARWAMRALNDAVEDQQSLAQNSVPLLARHRGRLVFVVAPFVADDPVLGEIWQTSYPILDADRDVRQLQRCLRLRRLDDEVMLRPKPLLPRDDIRDKLAREIEFTKPYLAAVAARAVPSRKDEVLRGLTRLEVEACRQLVLECTLDGETRERADVASFIAVRREQEGKVRRNVGTAFLQIADGGEPPWFQFGPQLASFLNVPTQGDAFALLLSGSKQVRERFRISRGVSDEELDEARSRLDQPPDHEDALEDLFGGLDAEIDSEPEGGGLGGVAAVGDHAAPSTGEDPTHGEDSDEPATRESVVMPAVRLDDVRIEDMSEPAVGVRSSPPRSAAGGGLGPVGAVDHEAIDRRNRELGRRGEEVAVEAERRSLVLRGLDPMLVVWRSQVHPFAPYDIESLDEDGQRIYIEVKATTSSNPHDPFEISEAELLFALRKHSSYYVYRVTAVDSAAPRIFRFRDPLKWVKDGVAQVRISNARMSFGRADVEGEVASTDAIAPLEGTPTD